VIVMERPETLPSRWVAARWRPAFGVAVASEFAGLIHLAFTREHLHEWVPFGLFFLASGLFQVVWAVMVFSPQRRAFFLVGLVVNVATVILWAVTRTTGLPVGPEHWTPEAVGVPDVAASILELLIAAGCVWILETGRRSGRPATY
jgi:hypothetical protein